MKIGDIVKVYEDPLTEKKLEGKAKIVKIYPNQPLSVLLICKVQFLGESSNHVRTVRYKK